MTIDPSVNRQRSSLAMAAEAVEVVWPRTDAARRDPTTRFEEQKRG
jgi:hypothetical protein